jgi:hypothetical protein
MTSDTLLTNVKDRAAIPPAQVSLTDAKLLTAATEELQAYIAPVLDQLHSEYFTLSADTSIVSGTSGYDMPARAMGGALRALKFVDSSGIECPDPLSQIDLADVGKYAAVSASYPTGFYFTATQVVVLPTPTASSGSLRMYYSARPGTLVNGTSVSTLASTTDTVLTCGAVDTSVFAVGALVDIVGAGSPFKTKGRDLIVTARNATTITIGAGGLSALGLVAGDYVTLAQTSYVPQIPLEWHSLLSLRTVARAFAVLGDMNGRQEAVAAAQELERRLVRQGAPRAASNPRKFSAWR